ncbi:DNA pilot protein [Tortoise microvirus 29]|nr:DNA pilot protein [Tortoise microvirus 29]
MSEARDAALIQGVSSLASSAASYAATTNINKKTRKYNEYMYDKQKADNLAFWQMQNEYNSPQSQMERLRDAGLNPNLVYGASAPGNSSSQVQTPSQPSWNPETPKMDLGLVAGQAINTYYDLRMKKAQYDNLKAMNTQIMEQAELTRSRRINEDARNLGINVNSQYSADFHKYRLEQLKKELQLKDADLDYKTLNNKFMTESFSDRLQGIKSTNELRENQILLQQMDLNLRSKGIYPGDPWYLRIMTATFGKELDSLLQFLKK